MLEIVLSAVAETAIAYAMEQSGMLDKVRALLGRDPTRRAFEASLGASLQEVQSDYPQLASTLFDAHFIKHGAGPILGKYLDGSGTPNATELAHAWAAQLGQRVTDQDMSAVSAVTTMAEAYLQALERHLRRHPEFTYVFQDRVIDALASIDKSVGRSPIGELRIARDLVRASFSLGDDAAATFPFVVAPIQECWEIAAKVLVGAELANSHSSVLLLLGAANSGKTRLALEAIMTHLPDWHVLRWRPDYTPTQIPSDDLLHNLDVVIFADDLHEYVSHMQFGTDVQFLGDDGHARTLQTLIERVRACTRHSVVVATCRDEREDDLFAALPQILSHAVTARLPNFDLEMENQQTRDIVEAFASRGARYCDEWDGTLGSLVLGLNRKRAQYLSLRDSPAGAILRAMKLLTIGRTSEHTKRRIQLVCGEVFGETRIAAVPTVWDNAVNELVRAQFVAEDIRSIDGAPRLIVRKDSYLDRVVADYPSSYRPTWLDQHLSALRIALTGVGDTNALSNLGVAYFDLHRLKDALAVYTEVLDLDPSMAIAWQNKGNALFALGRHGEALQASDKALELDPSSATAWSNRGAILAGLDQPLEALAAFDRSIELDPANETTIINRCSVLTKLGRTEEALVQLDKMRVTQQDNPTFWHNLGTILQTLEEWDSALVALDRALKLEPTSTRTQASKMAVLGGLGRLQEALACSESVIDSSPGAELVWHNRGKVLHELGDLEGAIAAHDHALSLRPDLLLSLVSKAFNLIHLQRWQEAMEVADLATKVDPKSKEAWHHLGTAQLKLGFPEKAILSFDVAIVLDPAFEAAWTNKGIAYAHLNQAQQAINSFQRCLELNPQIEAAAKNLKNALASASNK